MNYMHYIFSVCVCGGGGGGGGGESGDRIDDHF